MSLRLQAELDLSFTLEDKECGFGWDIVIEFCNGESQSLTGQQNDISFSIDPDTGLFVMSEKASVVVRFSTLNLSREPRKGDFIRVSDINGNEGHYVIQQVLPDRTLGIIVLILQISEEE